MTVNNFAFTPADGLRNAVSFPTSPASEADARDQVQDISDQIRDYINTTIIAAINGKLDLSGGTLTGNLTLPALIASGLTGATAATRFVGGTTSGAPTAGTFAKGDYAIDQTGMIWICTTAGTPGTWAKPASPGVTNLSGGSKIQSGSFSTGTIASGTSAATSVTFPVAFSSAPIIALAFRPAPNSNLGYNNVTFDQPTTTGFTCNIATYSGQAFTVHWTAIGS